MLNLAIKYLPRLSKLISRSWKLRSVTAVAICRDVKESKYIDFVASIEKNKKAHRSSGRFCLRAAALVFTSLVGKTDRVKQRSKITLLFVTVFLSVLESKKLTAFKAYWLPKHCFSEALYYFFTVLVSLNNFRVC